MVKRFCTILVTLAFTILSIQSAFAQKSPQFYIDVSPKAGSLDETFVFSVVIENASNPGDPYLIGGDDFEVTLLGPKSSTLIANGVVSTQLAYNYSLTAKHEGLLDTPSAEVEIDGKKYTAPAVKVKVTKSQMPQPDSKDDAVFLKQTLDKKEVYVGEQVGYTFSLYTSLSIFDPQITDSSFDGFWAENMGDADKNATSMGGKRYDVVRWYKALYPIRAGKLEINSRSLMAKVRVKNQPRGFPFGSPDPFDDQFDAFFGRGQFEERRLSSNSADLDVKPLPPAPSNFPNWNLNNVLVGTTSLKVEYSKDAIKTGDSKTVTLELETRGNASPITKLPLSESPDYKLYQEASQEKKYVSGGMLVAQKTFRFSLVPLKPGKLEINGFSLGYFDPLISTYQVAHSDPITFEVTGPDLRNPEEKSIKSTASEAKVAPKSANTTQPNVSKSHAPVIYEEDSSLEKLLTKISLSLSLLVLASAILIAVIIYLVLKVINKRKPIFQVLNSLSQAQDLAMVNSIYRSFLSKRFGAGHQYTSSDELRVVLKNQMINKNLLFTIENTLDEIDAMLYSKTPSPTDLSTLKSTIQKVVKLLS